MTEQVRDFSHDAIIQGIDVVHKALVDVLDSICEARNVKLEEGSGGPPLLFQGLLISLYLSKSDLYQSLTLASAIREINIP